MPRQKVNDDDPQKAGENVAQRVRVDGRSQKSLYGRLGAATTIFAAINGADGLPNQHGRDQKAGTNVAASYGSQKLVDNLIDQTAIGFDTCIGSFLFVLEQCCQAFALALLAFKNAVEWFG